MCLVGWYGVGGFDPERRHISPKTRSGKHTHTHTQTPPSFLPSLTVCVIVLCSIPILIPPPLSLSRPFQTPYSLTLHFIISFPITLRDEVFVSSDINVTWRHTKARRASGHTRSYKGTPFTYSYALRDLTPTFGPESILFPLFRNPTCVSCIFFARDVYLVFYPLCVMSVPLLSLIFLLLLLSLRFAAPLILYLCPSSPSSPPIWYESLPAFVTVVILPAILSSQQQTMKDPISI